MAKLDPAAQALLDALHADDQSGATELTLKTLRELAEYVRLERPKRGKLTALVDTLRDARPSMVVIANAMVRVQEQLQADDREPVAAIERVHEELTVATDTLINHARSQIPEAR